MHLLAWLLCKILIWEQTAEDGKKGDLICFILERRNIEKFSKMWHNIVNNSLFLETQYEGNFVGVHNIQHKIKYIIWIPRMDHRNPTAIKWNSQLGHLQIWKTRTLQGNLDTLKWNSRMTDSQIWNTEQGCSRKIQLYTPTIFRNAEVLYACCSSN